MGMNTECVHCGKQVAAIETVCGKHLLIDVRSEKMVGIIRDAYVYLHGYKIHKCNKRTLKRMENKKWD